MEEEINLLPEPFQKARMRSIYLLRLNRFWRVLGVFLGALALAQVGIVIFYSVLQEEAVRQRTQLTDGNMSAYERVMYVNRLAREFRGSMEEQTEWTALLMDLFERVEGVIITGLSSEHGSRVLEIEGEASSREAVLSLQRSLEELGWVDNIEAPLQNFTVGPATTEFSLNLRLAEEI